jgi:hypothetical protein
MRNAAKSQAAPELCERSERIVNIDDGIAGDDPVRGCVCQWQLRVLKKMGGDAVGKARGLGPSPGPPDELCIDVYGMDVPGGTNLPGELEGRVPRAATEVHHYMA